MADKDSPNRASNMEQAEGDRWTSDPDAVERQDRERPESGADVDQSPSRKDHPSPPPQEKD
jgi:hypothetical protein